MDPRKVRTCETCAYELLDGNDVPCRNCNDHSEWEAVDALPEKQGDEATKHDSGKPRYDLIPPEPLDGLACLYGMGAAKYEERNWEKGMNWSRIFGAMMRHAWKWFRGEDYDREDGQHHLLSVIWCAMALYTYAVRSTGNDDRPRPFSSPFTYDAVWRAVQRGGAHE